jgi:hypothetical protein
MAETALSTHRRLSRQARLVSFAVAGALSWLVIGCSNPVDWTDFGGVNLIAGRDFGDLHETDPAAMEPVWAVGTADYLLFEEVSVTEDAVPELSSEMTPTDAVYRLELLNLVPNGDFEDPDTASSIAPWQRVGNTGARVVQASTYNATPEAGGVDLAPLHGERVLSVNFEDRLARFFIDLSPYDPRVTPGSMDEGAQYAFFLDFRTRFATFPLALNRVTAGGELTDEQNQVQINRGEPAAPTTTYRYPGVDGDERGRSEPGANTFTIGDTQAVALSIGGDTAVTEQRGQLLLDNVRVVRSDPDLIHGIELVVPQGRDPLQPDRPALVAGGTYTFSLWIGRDLSAGENNRFDPHFMTLRVVAEETRDSDDVTFNPTTHQTVVPLDTGTLANWGSTPDDGGWTRTEFSFPGPNSPEFQMRVSILFGGEDGASTLFPGSILIAEPRLTYRPQ